MSGYRCVNYFELCRLCTSSTGAKTHIFSDEGRKQDLMGKIAVCLPVVIDEQDKLPKILCTNCLSQVETIAKFRETCINAQTMLESCLNTSKLRNGGKVYIKDVSSKRIITQGSSPAPFNNVKTIGTTTIRPVSQKQPPTKTTSSDFLSNIIQAVGIQNVDDEKPIPIIQQQSSAPQQYTITLDGHNIKNQIHYKIEPAQSVTVPTTNSVSTSTSSMDEFLKLKPPTTKMVTKKKILTNRVAVQTKNLRGNVIPRRPITTPQPTPIKRPDVKLHSQNQSYPVKFKDVTSDQQILTQINTKNLVLPGSYIKLQPQITTVNGQQLVQLSHKNMSNLQVIGQATNKQTNQNIASNQIISVTGSSLIQTSNETKTMFTTASGQNVTITHQPLTSLQQSQLLTSPQPMQLIQIHQPNMGPTDSGTVQLTTLQNVQAPLPPQPLPSKSGITIQRIKTETLTQPRRFATPNANSDNKSIIVKSQPQRTLPTFKTPPGGALKTKTKFVGSTKPTLNKTSTTQNPKLVKPKTPGTNSSGNPVNPDSPSCSVCNKVFKRKEHLAQHMKLHLGLRPFKCDENECNKSFSRKEHLMRHVVSHTGQKMFSCEYCQKLFSRKDNLNKHKRSHEGKEIKNEHVDV